MANTILASANQYQFPSADRDLIRSEARNPSKRISSQWAMLIEKQRQLFIRNYGNDGVRDCT